MDQYIDANRKLWNDWTGLHEKSDFYDIEGFKAGGFRLSSLEKGDLGDVRGKTLLHLQCHFGLDTLSWANLGATVTGADFSDEAIALARRLSQETGIPATFVLSNIYDLPSNLEGQFDIVFTSHGVLGWLPDIPAWGKVVGHFLKPGGTFYIAEVHPFSQVFDEEDPSELRTKYPYFQGQEPLRFEVQGSYASNDSSYRGVEYGWNHTLSSFVNALISAGLQIEQLNEYPFLTWRGFPFMERNSEGYWQFNNEYHNRIPLMFTIKAVKAET